MKYTIIFRVIYCRVQDIIGERLEVAQTASEALAEIKSSESLRRQKSGISLIILGSFDSLTLNKGPSLIH